MPPVIEAKKCIVCGQCTNVCSEDVFFGSQKGEVPIVTYPDECWHCNACVLDCPAEGTIKLRIPLPMIISYK